MEEEKTNWANHLTEEIEKLRRKNREAEQEERDREEPQPNRVPSKASTII